MESQEFKKLSFCIVFRKNKRQHFKKKEAKNTLFLDPFYPNLDKKKCPQKSGSVTF